MKPNTATLAGILLSAVTCTQAAPLEGVLGGMPTKASGDPASASAGSLFDTGLPGLDPSAGGLRFNGQTWEVGNNAAFRAKFEKFLSTPEETNEQEQAHRMILNEIIALLDPNTLKPQTLSDAYRLLARAASYPGDSRLCDTLSGSIYAVWQSRRNQERLGEANRILSEEKALARRNMATSATSDQNATKASAAGSAIIQAGRAGTIASNEVQIKSNSIKGELSELQAKIQYQGLLVQLLIQRRFHHVIIGTRFYRALFSDGDSKLNLPNSEQNPFSKSSGMPPTVATIDSLANEAMREVQTGVQSFHKLFDLGDLRSASERLRDAVLVGEFMPEVRTLPFERKRKVLSFIQNTGRLQAALETKDYTTAQQILDGEKGLKSEAADFDATKVRALIETARNSARLLLSKARTAANFGDKDGFEAALKEAAAIWPSNPELQEVATTAFNKGDILAQAQLELEQLIAQKNFRRIADEAGRFAAATQTSTPEKQAQLKTILEDFKALEAALMTAAEMDRQGNPAGAWEAVEKMGRRFPDDVPLNQAQAHYTTKAAEFVRTVQNALEHEKRTEMATSLAWYLKAQRIYPKSNLAEESIRRLQAQVLQGVSR